MILVDFSQISMASILVNDITQADLIRHMLMNSILNIKTKFNSEYGGMVICCDSRKSWRDDVFPHYKARRRSKHKDDIHWPVITSTIKQFKEEVKEYTSYRVVEVERAEGDDIIATICMRVPEKHVIVSGDKDFQQLQSQIVQQYDPVNTKKMIVCNSPRKFLLEHIIRGDSQDDIPNIFSDGDTFVTGKKSKPIMQKKLDVWLDISPDRYCDEKALARMEENRTLIDLSKIPVDLQESIMSAYDSHVSKKSRLFEYFTKHRMTKLLGEIQNF